MGVFSPNALTRIPEVLESYPMNSRAQVVLGVTEGIENSTFFVETADEELIVTLFERRVSKAHIDLAEEMMLRARASGLSTPRILRTKAGQNHCLLDDRLWVLQSHCDGVAGVDLDETQHYNAGNALGRLHNACRDIPFAAPNSIGWKQWPGLLTALESIEPEARELHSIIAEDVRNVASNWPMHLPSGPVHGDYFSSNVLILGNRFSIIDFFLCSHDLLAYDIGLALTSFGFDKDNQLRETYIDSFLRGYQEARSLSEDEFEAIPYLARMGAIRIILTRSLDRFRRTRQGAAEVKAPEQFLNRYQQLKSLKL